MANKIYTVVKDGEELDKLKTLASAKKLADTEGGEVYSDGKCVYRTAEENNAEDAGTAAETAQAAVPEAEADESAETATKPADEAPVKEKGAKGAMLYRLKSLMNVRKKPDGEIVRTLPEGTVVEVAVLENDWLHLTDGNFILYHGGEFAEKI